MESSPSVVVVVGAGQLGSRYLQGLIKCSKKLDVYVIDIDPKALLVARKRCLELVNADKLDKFVHFYEDIRECPKKVDLAIISTTAKKRVELVTFIKKHLMVRYWILEKLLAQSSNELDDLSKLLSGCNVWVNTPRRMLIWHKKIRASLIKQKPLHLLITGRAWGLACNSVHFLDMFAWFTGETLENISTQGLSQHWIKAKRLGNWEIFGEIKATFSQGSTASILAKPGELSDLNYQFHIQDNNTTWLIDEENGIAERSDGLSIPGRLPFQSEVTSSLVDELIATGRCELPSLQTSSDIHRVFLDAMLSHWKKTVDENALLVPIT